MIKENEQYMCVSIEELINALLESLYEYANKISDDCNMVKVNYILSNHNTDYFKTANDTVYMYEHLEEILNKIMVYERYLSPNKTLLLYKIEDNIYLTKYSQSN